MQTFLPYPSFTESAKVLDNKRLGKQRVEAKQIYLALTVAEYGWKNHPAVKMWRGAEFWLCEYGMVVCKEWRARGFRDSLLPQFDAWQELHVPFGYGPSSIPEELISWLGNPAFHTSHRSNLLRKDPTWYGQFGWAEPDDLPYVWPKP